MRLNYGTKRVQSVQIVMYQFFKCVVCEFKPAPGWRVFGSGAGNSSLQKFKGMELKLNSNSNGIKSNQLRNRPIGGRPKLALFSTRSLRKSIPASYPKFRECRRWRVFSLPGEIRFSRQRNCECIRRCFE